MPRYFVVYSNAEMPHRHVRLQPLFNELVYGFIHGDEKYIKRRAGEVGLAENEVCRFRIDDVINEDRLDRLFVDTAITFRRGPYNRFFVQADQVNEFIEEFRRCWNEAIPINHARALERVRDGLINR